MIGIVLFVTILGVVVLPVAAAVVLVVRPAGVQIDAVLGRVRLVVRLHCRHVLRESRRIDVWLRIRDCVPAAVVLVVVVVVVRDVPVVVVPIPVMAVVVVGVPVVVVAVVVLRVAVVVAVAVAIVAVAVAVVAVAITVVAMAVTVVAVPVAVVAMPVSRGAAVIAAAAASAVRERGSACERRCRQHDDGKPLHGASLGLWALSTIPNKPPAHCGELQQTSEGCDAQGGGEHQCARPRAQRQQPQLPGDSDSVRGRSACDRQDERLLPGRPSLTRFLAGVIWIVIVVPVLVVVLPVPAILAIFTLAGVCRRCVVDRGSTLVVELDSLRVLGRRRHVDVALLVRVAAPLPVVVVGGVPVVVVPVLIVAVVVVRVPVVVVVAVLVAMAIAVVAVAVAVVAVPVSRGAVIAASASASFIG